MPPKPEIDPELLAVYDLLKIAKYDPDSNPPPDTTVLTIGGRPVGSLGNFAALTGKPKAGKTTFLASMLGSAYLPGDIWDIKLTTPVDRPFIQYYDTEQSLYYFHRLMTRVKKMIGMENLPRNLSGFLLREFDPAKLMQMIELGIALNPNASIIFIDGFLDLCENYNDERASLGVIRWLKRITKQYNVFILGVIHQSKKEAYSLGHLGSAVDRWAESTMQIEKDQTRKFITLSALLLRNTIDEFTPVTIMHNGEDFEKADIDLTAKKAQIQKNPSEFTDVEHKYILSQVIPEAGILHADLIEAVYENKGFSKIKCRHFITYWIEQQYVFRDKNKLYHRTKEAKLFIALNNN